MTRAHLDLRLAPAALGVWGAAALGLGWSPVHAFTGGALLLGGACLVSSLDRHRRPADGQRPGPARWSATVVVGLIATAAAFGVAALRTASVHAGPLDELALSHASVQVDAVVTSDPVSRQGTFAAYTVTRLRVDLVTARGRATRVRTPILVIADETWLRVSLGEHVATTGRLQPAIGTDVAAVLLASARPRVTAAAPWTERGIGAVRQGLVEAARPLPDAEGALVPALVDGDDSTMPPEVATDFRTTGLTHLLAVSGSNLTLVLAFVLVVARWSGVRGRWTVLVGLVAVAFFVLLARPQPSVLRAAAMGVVALAGLTSGGTRGGTRALSVAVVGLVLLDPALARSIGFLLSTTATAGILLLAPGWRDRLGQWMPRPLAEAIAVPLAAQVACTPAIAAISGQVSLVAVAANVLAAPAVGPATVIGLMAGLAALVNDPLAHLAGRLAGVPAWWIVAVSRQGAGFSGASVEWAVGPMALAALVCVCVALVALLPRVLGSRLATGGVGLLLVLAVVQPLGRLGWPPSDWLMVMCDVGQGDGIVLNAGAATAVVVDAGPDPRAMDRCLQDLGVRRVALVVLTHFHADHVNGLPGVLHSRQVGEIETTGLRDPPDRAAAVDAWADRAGVPVTVAALGESRQVGTLSWTVIGPVTRSPPSPAAGDGAGPNNASVVMLVASGGHRMLLSGDAEPEEEGDVLDEHLDLEVDVFKVAHHGSANQDAGFVLGTAATLALISVGADNDYGHPAPETLALLHRLGAATYRTDQDGDIAVVDRAGQLGVVTSN